MAVTTRGSLTALVRNWLTTIAWRIASKSERVGIEIGHGAILSHNCFIRATHIARKLLSIARRGHRQGQARQNLQRFHVAECRARKPPGARSGIPPTVKDKYVFIYSIATLPILHIE
ncbi:hypothetical protein ACVOMT_19090 [Sphingomonas panni]